MEEPAELVPGAVTTKCDVAAGLTTIAPVEIVRVLWVVSVAVSVWLAAVVNVALNVPTPDIRVLFAGILVEAP